MMSGRALAGALVISCVVSVDAGEPLSGSDLKRLFPGQFQAVINGAMVMRISARSDGSLV